MPESPTTIGSSGAGPFRREPKLSVGISATRDVTRTDAHAKPTSVAEALDGDAERILLEPGGRREVSHAKRKVLDASHHGLPPILDLASGAHWARTLGVG
jgi:hypothetical protein